MSFNFEMATRNAAPAWPIFYIVGYAIAANTSQPRFTAFLDSSMASAGVLAGVYCLALIFLGGAYVTDRHLYLANFASIRRVARKDIASMRPRLSRITAELTTEVVAVINGSERAIAAPLVPWDLGEELSTALGGISLGEYRED